ncbi:translation initiation factor IF-2 [Fructobacillus sp. M1-13]|uniref:Translation initiation factor IF-2 n=1 Tax=Fructobacillus papyriferae TaxID=2713171 RepID=A0ABS5QNC5_9LACO|nr:translation initiation factor IF-2 [Fructobacillus papyriferae]MBS9334608.1 translation initiation factor IF-2 [Fructobacillus papyriferae]MCD2158598.1 translation initiation factor IF-2 [Fructobacillus papyriferae]
MAEEKKFSGSNRKTRKMAVPERKELPASQRRHAAKLSDGAAKPASPSRPRPKQNGPRNEQGGQNRHNARPGQGGSRRPNNRTNNPSSGRPMIREKKSWSTKPREGQVNYSAQKDDSLKEYVAQNNKAKQEAKKAAEKKAQKAAKPAQKPAANAAKPAAGNGNGTGRFGGSLSSGNNSARNNTRKRNTNGTGQQTPRRNDKPHGSKKARRIAAKQAPKKQPTVRKEQPLPEVLEYKVGMNVQDLSKLLHRDTAEIIKKLFLLGIVTNQNQSLDEDTIEILAADYGIDAKQKEEEDLADIDRFFDEAQVNEENLAPRAPVVTIMGHVDHGKTTLLDYLRKTNVTEGEAGGITQHIGAYQARLDGRLITFLDTPGHAAFTEMRARGANVTDITVLVVAADDGVQPQTIEAINHAKSAGTPVIVAVNKIDKEGANPEQVMNQLMAYDLVPEEYGGSTIFVKISAKKGENIEQLLEMILLEADVLELQADPTVPARGSVIEARLDKGRGPVSTVLVQQGTLHVGDPVVVGNTYGRIRTMQNEKGVDLKEAKPATPVQITGLNEVPSAGDRFVVMADEKSARAAGEERAKRAREEVRNAGSVVTLDTLFNTMAEKAMKTVPVVVKADVQGSVEALVGSLKKIEVDGVKVDVVHAAVGAINESDVSLAEASGALILGFNVRPTPFAKNQAQADKIDMRFYSVIYDAIDDVTAAMKGQLEPVYEERVIGQIVVKELFKFSKVGTIAGATVEEGKIKKDAKVRIVRNGTVIYDGALASLQRGKDAVNEVKFGYDFGFTVNKFNDIQLGDEVEAYIMEEVKPK